MRVGTYLVDGTPRPAVFLDDEVHVYDLPVLEFIEVVHSDGLDDLDYFMYPLSELRIGPPVPRPPKIICFGLNYREHVEELREMGMDVPSEPVMTMKAPTAVIGHLDTVKLPREARRVDHELELAVVIGERCRKVSPEEARDAVLGFTIINDVTARDIEKREGQWVRAKSYDTFAPLGPWIETELEPDGLEMELRVNGEVRQRATTDDMVRDPYELVSFTSRVMTLEPGDIIATGTPPGVGPMEPDDKIELEIERIGRLVHYVEQ
ncbi:fumarylacetoacetate hydrolase family protein [Methanopyrus kandleri]